MGESVAREMGISDARANMTEVIAEVRLLGQPVVLTRRDKPQAVLVSTQWYADALRSKSIAEAAVQLIGSASPPDEAVRRLQELADQIQRDTAKSS